MCVSFRLPMKCDSIRLKIRKSVACIPNLHQASQDRSALPEFCTGCWHPRQSQQSTVSIAKVQVSFPETPTEEWARASHSRENLKSQTTKFTLGKNINLPAHTI